MLMVAFQDRKMEDSAPITQPDQAETGSDADTDELLTHADLLCSGASDKQRNAIQSASSTARTPSKVRRSLNFDIDKPSSERKRQLKATLDLVSQSCPSTPKDDVIAKKLASSPTDSTAVRSNMAAIPFSIPLNSFAIVQLSSKTEDPIEESSICEKRVDILRSILATAKGELTNASQLIHRAMSPHLNGSHRSDSGLGSTSISTSLSLEERSFVDRLSSGDLRELYEAEACKRRYCEKKIELLQKQLLDLEQKLSVATVAVDRYKNVVGQVEQSCTDFIDDVTTKERERTRAYVGLKNQNEQLKTALERVIVYGQALGEKLETCNDRVQSLEKDLDDQASTISALESENAKLKDDSSRQLAEINALKKKLEQSEAQKKASFEREEQLTKELLAMERSSKENSELVQKLTKELNNEKTSRRSQLEEKDRQHKERVAELAKDFDSRVEKTRLEIEQRTASEMRKLKDEWDTVLYGLSEKYGRMVNERDEALRRLKEYEDTFTDRQRIMCYELQQRLSAKYYELLSEFSPVGLPSSTNGNPNPVDPPSDYQGATSGNGQHTDPSWLSSSMADEFLERLRGIAYPPGATPRHLRSEPTKDQTKQVASTSTMTSNQRACPPPDGPTKKK